MSMTRRCGPTGSSSSTRFASLPARSQIFPRSRDDLLRCVCPLLLTKAADLDGRNAHQREVELWQSRRDYLPLVCMAIAFAGASSPSPRWGGGGGGGGASPRV